MKRRSVAVIVTLALLFQFSGCKVKKVHRLDPVQVQNPERERIVGVTTKNGEEVSFDPYGTVVKGGSIQALVKKQPYQISLDQVQRLWVQRQETSTIRTIGLVAAVVVGTIVVTAAIIVATKQSCPFIYSWDGAQYVFDAEPYGGAITRGLERDDYSELEHLRPENGFYRLKIGNEVPETQFTNLLELKVVDHNPATRVVSDEWGRLHTISALRAPLSAREKTGHDLLPWLQATDKLIWEPDAVADSRGNTRQEVVLTFPKERGAKHAKLVANAATGLWGSYMIKAMLELRGRDLEQWYARVDSSRSEANALFAWNIREELYALKLYVEEPTGWEVRGIMPGGGPFIAEDRVVTLDVSRVPGDQLRIRIRPPAGFWAFNSFAVDYTSDESVRVETVPPAEARTDHGQSVLAELQGVDDSYYEMPRIGDCAYLRFPAPPSRSGMKRTVFLHSRGYYRLHLTGSGDPDTATLQQIQSEPDAAALFAAARFAAWRRNSQPASH